jgi:hypothetical protein
MLKETTRLFRREASAYLKTAWVSTGSRPRSRNMRAWAAVRASYMWVKPRYAHKTSLTRGPVLSFRLSATQQRINLQREEHPRLALWTSPVSQPDTDEAALAQTRYLAFLGQASVKSPKQ